MRKNNQHFSVFYFLLSWAIPTHLDAQYSATAKVEQPFLSTNTEDPTASATVIEVENRAQAAESLEDLFVEVPGARIQRTGFDGAFSGLNLRGGNFEHTTVLFGNIPIHSVDGSAFDFSALPLSLIESVEVYRGGAPLWLGATGIGGVVRLVPKKPKHLFAEGQASAGSFDTYSTRLTSGYAGNGRRPSLLVTAGFKHTDGDFPFVHDRGTAFNSQTPNGSAQSAENDDQTVRRQNGQQDEGWALGSADWKMLGGKFETLFMSYGRTGGISGPVVQIHKHVRQKQFRFLGGFNWRWESSERVHSNTNWRVEWSSFAHVQKNEVTDLEAELYFVPRKSNDESFRWFTRLAAQWNPFTWLTLSSVNSFQLETFDPEDILSASQAASSDRKTGNLGLEALAQGSWGPVRAQLRPSIQLQTSIASLRDIQTDRLGEESNTQQTIPTFRVGGAVELWKHVSIVGSFSSASRLPTLVELFGNRGFLRGNLNLKPEYSLGGDLGLLSKGTTKTSFADLGGSVEVKGFMLKIDHLIRYVGTAQGALIPFNIDRASIQGLELGTKGWVGPAHLQATATFMKTRDEAIGRSLPFRPQLQLYTKAEGYIPGYKWLDEIVLYSDVQYSSSRFYDAFGVNVIPYHVLWGLGAAAHLLNKTIRLRFSANNLLNQASFDLVGFPLPGRFFMFDFTIQKDMDS